MKSKHLPLIVFAVGIVAFIGGCTPTTTLDTVRAPVINDTLVADVSVLQEAQSLLEAAALAENQDTKESLSESLQQVTALLHKHRLVEN